MAQQENNPNQSKPTLVFLPGTLCTSAVFDGLVKSDLYHSQVLNLSAEHSLSATTAKLKQQIGERNVVLVGFSMGGMLAFDFIRHYPNQVTGLCLINSNCHADQTSRKAGRMQHFQLAQEQGLTQLMREVYLPVYFSDPDSSAAQLVVDMAEQIGMDGFAAQLEILATRPDSASTLAQFTKPTLIMGSDNDLPCPVSHQQFMAAQAKNSELHIMKGAGHFAILEQSAQIHTYIEHWVNTHYV